MRAKVSRLSVLIAAFLVTMSVLPASDAQRPEIRVGVVSEHPALDRLPPNAKAERIPPGHLNANQLARYDALLLDAAVLDSLPTNGTRANAVRQFVADHRVLLVQGDSGALARATGVAPPKGEDVPMLADGSPAPVAASANALYRSSRGTWHHAVFAFGTPADFRSQVAAQGAEWVLSLEDFQPRAGQPMTASAADNSNWQSWGSTSYSYTWSPYGRIAFGARFYYALNDGSTSFDWWNVDMTQTTVPGTNLWGNGWRTSVGWVVGDQKAYIASNQLSDWGPRSIDATGRVVSLGFEVGMRAGVDSAPFTSTQSYGYMVEDMLVSQASSASTEYLFVRHEFGYGSGPANGFWSNKPAWTVRVNEGACLKIPFQNKAEWREYTYSGYDNYYTTWINSWREICK